MGDRINNLIRQGWRIYSKSDFNLEETSSIEMKEYMDGFDRVMEEDDDNIYVRDKKLHEIKNNA